jgi:hypothetical protein
MVNISLKYLKTILKGTMPLGITTLSITKNVIQSITAPNTAMQSVEYAECYLY